MTDVDAVPVAPAVDPRPATADPAEAGADAERRAGRCCSGTSRGRAGKDSAVELVEAPPGDRLDRRFQPLDVTPLPPEWHPATW